MLYLTQLIFVRAGHEAAFREFEDVVLPLLPRYGGELVLRLRPGPDAVIATSSKAPYEVHVLRFANEADIERYASDELRQRHLHLKDASVESVLLIKGTASP